MGNVPGKEERPIGSTLVDDPSRRRSGSGAMSAMAVRDILNPSATFRKKKHLKDKEATREQTVKNLIVSHDDNVDGGFLAPYGVYTYNQDYNTEIVRRLIMERKLAPFYTPLQDFEEDWSDNELLIQLDKLPLHSSLPDEIIEDTILDPNSKHYQKHLQSRLFEKSLLEKRKQLQQEAQNRFEREKKLVNVNGFKKENIPSKELLLRLYKTSVECPICFLYYPNNFNYTRCCVQPICSECFVQIKRPDPHVPHEEPSNPSATEEDPTALPKDLVCEPAKCPFCAMPNFGITYSPPKDIRTGFAGVSPNVAFTVTQVSPPSSPSQSSDNETAIVETTEPIGTPKAKVRRHSLPPEHSSVITTDYIRPDWERKLSNARMKLARRSAAATAIHASSLLMNETGNGETRTRTDSNTDLEQKMIEEALRLSLLEEEDRKAKQRSKANSRR